MINRAEACFQADGRSAETVTAALCSASKGGQRTAAQYVIDRGGDINWVGWDDDTCLDVAVVNEDAEFAQSLRDQGARSASEAR